MFMNGPPRTVGDPDTFSPVDSSRYVATGIAKSIEYWIA
jgi:hypothetical protein